MAYELLIKPAYRTQLRALQRRDAELVERKVDLLIDNPHPDGKNKKRIVSYKDPVFRIRAGNYRVLYMFSDEARWVSLLIVDGREDVYEHGDLVDTTAPSFDFATIPADATALRQRSTITANEHQNPTVTELEEYLDQPVTRELLVAAGVVPAWFDALVGCTTIEALLVAPVPESVRSMVFDAATASNVETVIAQPSFVVRDVEDLIRYQRGELVDFLLKLDPDQERLVTRAVNAGGPVLVRGGPGTGKSTIAIYRTREVYRALQARGIEAPRILFTTYTNALISSTRQLIQQLFQTDEIDVTVQTADKIATGLLGQKPGDRPKIAIQSELVDLLGRAFDELEATEGIRIVERLGLLRSRLTMGYFLEEIESVIVARELDQNTYMTVRRFGRKVGLKKTDRKVFWRLHTLVTTYLAAEGLTTWARMRLQAAALVERGQAGDLYDAVFIDEAQDLQPAVIRMLASLCKSLDSLMLTADINQAIYGANFRWVDVQDNLRFRGRTGVLRKNYRSTPEIEAAALSYLTESQGLSNPPSIDNVVNGSVPDVRYTTWRDEIDYLQYYFRVATRDLRLGYGACAVLVPNEKVGYAIARTLGEHGISATFTKGSELDLRSSGVKVITHRSSKGLEFPIVALAGFSTMHSPIIGSDGEREEWQALERRALYVAMTRAMRTLLVLAPATNRTKLFMGFNEPTWNLGSM